MKRPRAKANMVAGGLACLSLTAFGCNTLQNSAAQDPMKCERDPKCTSHEEKSKDCVTVCVDDPACIDRCREVTGQGAYTR